MPIKVEMEENERVQLLKVLAVLERKAARPDASYWKMMMAPIAPLIARIKGA